MKPSKAFNTNGPEVSAEPPGQPPSKPCRGSGAQASSGERQVAPVEVAVLATLMTINHSIQHPDEKRQPTGFLSAARELLREAELSEACAVVAEAVNKLSRFHRRTGRVVDREYAWREVLRVQKQAPTGYSRLSRFVRGAVAGTRVPFSKEFETGFSHDDLVNRPAGISMVGSIGSEKGLRKAITSSFKPEQANPIIARKTMTLVEINQLLAVQLRIHRGHIPKVRPAKTRVT